MIATVVRVGFPLSFFESLIDCDDRDGLKKLLP